jgi:hypothetical protein
VEPVRSATNGIFAGVVAPVRAARRPAKAMVTCKAAAGIDMVHASAMSVWSGPVLAVSSAKVGKEAAAAAATAAPWQPRAVVAFHRNGRVAKDDAIDVWVGYVRNKNSRTRDKRQVGTLPADGDVVAATTAATTVADCRR